MSDPDPGAVPDGSPESAQEPESQKAKVRDFLDALEEVYGEDRKEAFAKEKHNLGLIYTTLARKIPSHYELMEPLGAGGSGVVVSVRDTILEVDRALKFPRPSPGQEERLAYVLTNEMKHLIRLSHPHLMPVYARGRVSVGNFDVPYYVMELYGSVVDADKYVEDEKKEIKEVDFVRLLERVLEAVTYMHRQDTVHLDIKPGNILVKGEREPEPVISDLGFAKTLEGGSGDTSISGTEGYVHPDARKFMQDAASDPNRLRGEVPRSKLKKTWDLYSLGRTILELLRVLEKRRDRPLSPYTSRYVKLLACRLLDGRSDKAEDTLLGLSLKDFDEIKYSKAEDALEDIRKLTGGFNLETRVPELDQFGSETIQVSTFSTTRFTPRVKALLEHDDISRLAGFTQLSLLNLVYPTATHTRLEHVMGAFAAMCRYITALYRDPINPIFRQIMTEQDIAAALVVSLVHDVGHYPLAHDLEEAESTIFSHEARGKVLLSDDSTGLREILEEEELNGAAGWGVLVERVINILEADVRDGYGDMKDRILHALIDGPIDADKLDYIVRDSANLGLTYGSVIDVERLLRVLTVVTHQKERETTQEQEFFTYVNIGIHEKGRVTAEAVAFARYALYGSVYWHHAYRAVKAMLQRMAWQYLKHIDRRCRADIPADNETFEFSINDTINRTVKNELYDAVGKPGEKVQLKKRSVQTQISVGAFTGSTHLHPGDYTMLEWLAGKSGDIGRELANLIQQRKLFKRVLVVSTWDKDKVRKRIWRSVTDVFSSNNWRLKLKLQEEFQECLVSKIDGVDDEGMDEQDKDTFREERNRFKESAQSGVVVLVDATRPKPGSTLGLEVVREEDRRQARISEAPRGKATESNLWKSLRTELDHSLGKVRVFCHPDHADFVRRFEREFVESALDEALSNK